MDHQHRLHDPVHAWILVTSVGRWQRLVPHSPAHPCHPSAVAPPSRVMYLSRKLPARNTSRRLRNYATYTFSIKGNIEELGKNNNMADCDINGCTLNSTSLHEKFSIYTNLTLYIGYSAKGKMRKFYRQSMGVKWWWGLSAWKFLISMNPNPF